MPAGVGRGPAEGPSTTLRCPLADCKGLWLLLEEATNGSAQLPSPFAAPSGGCPPNGFERLPLPLEAIGEGCLSEGCEGLTLPFAEAGDGLLPPSIADMLSGRLWG